MNSINFLTLLEWHKNRENSSSRVFYRYNYHYELKEYVLNCGIYNQFGNICDNYVNRFRSKKALIDHMIETKEHGFNISTTTDSFPYTMESYNLKNAVWVKYGDVVEALGDDVEKLINKPQDFFNVQNFIYGNIGKTVELKQYEYTCSGVYPLYYEDLDLTFEFQGISGCMVCDCKSIIKANKEMFIKLINDSGLRYIKHITIQFGSSMCYGIHNIMGYILPPV